MTVPYTISDDPQRFDRRRFHHWIADLSYWARRRDLEVTEAACDASLVWGAYIDGAMVGSARVVTDGVTFAWLCDVFVVEEHRGRGVAKMLREAVLAHPRDERCQALRSRHGRRP
jgi:GNAT superfamily N-acetyltransferase